MFQDHVPLAERIYAGSRMKLLVLGRDQIRRFVPGMPSVVISVTDPGQSDAEIAQTSLACGVLRLKFHDAKPAINIPGLTDLSLNEAPEIVMTSEDARCILGFVEEHIDQADLIICQCEAGVSRSAAIAAALSRILQNDDQFFFNHYWPNRWVYELLLKVASNTSTNNVP